MLRRLVFTGASWLLEGSAAFAKDVRYCAVWSCAKNAPTQEIPAED